jgi:hypothetical protein
MKPAVALLAAAFALAPVTGCTSLSDSSTSIGRSSNALSDSIANSSESSARSSGERQAAFLRDVREYAASFGRDGGEVAVLERDLGAVARSHGILDWERDDATYRELGQGFALAGLDEPSFAALSDRLAAQDARKRALLEQGYAAANAR